MYNLCILYLCCLCFCVSKHSQTKYITKNGIILRSTIEYFQSNNSSKENKNYFCLKIFLGETKLYFNVKNNVILPRDSVIYEKQKNVNAFCNPEDLIVEVNEFEIGCRRLAREDVENIFTDEKNKDLPAVCCFEKNSNNLNILLKFDKFSYSNKIFKASNVLECELYYTYNEFIYIKSFRNNKNINNDSVKMDITKLVLIDINKIKDLLNNKTIVTNLKINGDVEIINVDTEKLVAVKKKTNLLKEKKDQIQKNNLNDKEPEEIINDEHENKKDLKEPINFRENVKNKCKTNKIFRKKYKYEYCITIILVSVIFLFIFLCILMGVFVAYRRKRNIRVAHYTTVDTKIIYFEV